MKLKIDGFEVEINARWGSNPEEGNEERDTMDFLNKVCIWASEAAQYMEHEGFEAAPKYYQKASDDIYIALLNKGYYDPFLSEEQKANLASHFVA